MQPGLGRHSALLHRSRRRHPLSSRPGELLKAPRFMLHFIQTTHQRLAGLLLLGLSSSMPKGWKSVPADHPLLGIYTARQSAVQRPSCLAV